MAKILITFIHAYQFLISPLIGMRCRFQPTCSQYMMDAIKYYGAIQGTWLGHLRLSRCHPYTKGGLDPVIRIKDKNYNG